MRKRFLGIILVMAAALSMTACTGSGSASTVSASTDSASTVSASTDSSGTDSANTVSSTDAAAESQADGTVKKILWTYAGDLEAQEGSDKNIGTAGLLSGVSGGYVIAGGGANFP
ncbi:MAG: hypothetical protein LUK37_21670, partial [Clostridia bacterium]|nr:hypothetical protein [Clostridia bacterium]